MKCLLLGGTGFIGKKIMAQRPNWEWVPVGSANADIRYQDQIKKLYGNGWRLSKEDEETILKIINKIN